MPPLVGGEFAGELALTIVGGVAAGLILEMFRARGGAPAQNQYTAKEGRNGGFFSGLLLLALAVGGGVLLTLVIARPLIQAGIVPRSPLTRPVLVVGAAMLLWILLYAARRR